MDTDDACEVHNSGQGCCQQCVYNEERRCDKQEGKFDRLGDAAQDRGQRHGKQQSQNLLFLLRTCGLIECQRDTGAAEYLGEAGCSKACLRNQRTQRLGGSCDFGQLVCPVRVQTARDNCVVVVERRVQNVVQTEGNECTLEEYEDPDAQCAGRLDEALESEHAKLNLGPDKCCEQCDRNHHEETDHKYEGGTVERTQPVRQLGIEETVVQVNDDARDRQCTKHAHIKGLDVCDHRQTARAANLGTEVNTEYRSPLGKHGAEEVMEGEVQNQRFHAAACVLLLCHTDRQSDSEQQRQLIEHSPTTLKDYVPALIEQAVRGSKITHDCFGCE